MGRLIRGFESHSSRSVLSGSSDALTNDVIDDPCLLWAHGVLRNEYEVRGNAGSRGG